MEDLLTLRGEDKGINPLLPRLSKGAANFDFGWCLSLQENKGDNLAD
jgi:hypothetical protein